MLVERAEILDKMLKISKEMFAPLSFHLASEPKLSFDYFTHSSTSVALEVGEEIDSRSRDRKGTGTRKMRRRRGRRRFD